MIEEYTAANMNERIDDRRRRRLKFIQLSGVAYAAFVIVPPVLHLLKLMFGS